MVLALMLTVTGCGVLQQSRFAGETDNQFPPDAGYTAVNKKENEFYV